MANNLKWRPEGVLLTVKIVEKRKIKKIRTYPYMNTSLFSPISFLQWKQLQGNSHRRSSFFSSFSFSAADPTVKILLRWCSGNALTAAAFEPTFTTAFWTGFGRITGEATAVARFFSEGITGDLTSWLSSPNPPVLDDRNTRARLVVICELGFAFIDSFLELELEQGNEFVSSLYKGFGFLNTFS